MTLDDAISLGSSSPSSELSLASSSSSTSVKEVLLSRTPSPLSTSMSFGGA